MMDRRIALAKLDCAALRLQLQLVHRKIVAVQLNSIILFLKDIKYEFFHPY